MSKSKIEWCDRVWNPVTGCTRVSLGCDNCYAIRQSHRFARVKGSKFEGVTSTHPATSGHPSSRERDVPQEGNNIDWSGKVICHEDLLDMPMQWRKPSRVFVNSMSDLFHDDVPLGFIAQVFNTMASWHQVCTKKNCDHDGPDCFVDPIHTFMILTKRPLRMNLVLAKQLVSYCGEFMPGDCALSQAFEFGQWPLRNVWLGVSCENQAMADQRIPHLLKTPAAVRFVSYEPALGPINLGEYLDKCPQSERTDGKMHSWAFDGDDPYVDCCWCGQKRDALSGRQIWGIRHKPELDWIISGGESGPGARPMHPDWARSVRDQCKAAGVPFFFKQWGEWLPQCHEPFQPKQYTFVNRDGRPYRESMSILSNDGWSGMGRVGKREAGYLLDGIEYSEFPEGAKL